MHCMTVSHTLCSALFIFDNHIVNKQTAEYTNETKSTGFIVMLHLFCQYRTNNGMNGEHRTLFWSINQTHFACVTTLL